VICLQQKLIGVKALGSHPDSRGEGGHQGGAAAPWPLTTHTLLIHYAQVLDESADTAARLLSGQLGYAIPAAFAVNPIDL